MNDSRDHLQKRNPLTTLNRIHRLVLGLMTLLMVSAQDLNAQGYFTLSAQAGYRFPFARAPLNPLLENGFMSDNDAEQTPCLLGSYGSGSFAGLALHYVTGKSLEYGLQFSYCHFPEKTTHIGGSTRYDRIVYKANTIGMTPLIRLNKNCKGITPYLQFGLPLYWLEMSIKHQSHRSGEDRFVNQYHPRQLSGLGIMFGGGVKKTLKHFQVNMDVQVSGVPRNILPLSNIGLALGIVWKIN